MRTWGTDVSAKDVLVLGELSQVILVLHGEVLDDIEFDWGLGSLKNINSSAF
jgi:hypothetical protein